MKMNTSLLANKRGSCKRMNLNAPFFFFFFVVASFQFSQSYFCIHVHDFAFFLLIKYIHKDIRGDNACAMNKVFQLI